MARRPPNICKEPGCPEPALSGESRCKKHYDLRKKYKAFLRRKKPQVPYGPNWREISKAYRLAYPFCRVCGRPTEVVHHIIERAEGGTDDPDNLVALCNSCHSSYHWYKKFGNKEKRDEFFRKFREAK